MFSLLTTPWLDLLKLHKTLFSQLLAAKAVDTGMLLVVDTPSAGAFYELLYPHICMQMTYRTTVYEGYWVSN